DRLVVPVSQDASEAQRDSAWIASRPLDAVVGDLDDLLRADVDHVPLAVGLQLQEPLSLPLQHLVGHALERLAQHHELTGRGVAGTEVDVGEPAAASTTAPLH